MATRNRSFTRLPIYGFTAGALAQQGLHPDDVLDELQRRFGLSGLREANIDVLAARISLCSMRAMSERLIFHPIIP